MLITETPQGPYPMPAFPGTRRPSAATASSRRCRCCGSIPASRGACCGSWPPIRPSQSDPRGRRRAGQDPARDARRRDGRARRGAVRPLLRQRRRDAALRPARRPLRRAHRRPRNARRSCGPRSRPALGWIDRHGDPDGDGFVEYRRASERGPRQSGLEGFLRRDLPCRRHAGRGPDRARRGPGLRLRRQDARSRAAHGASGRTELARAARSGCRAASPTRFEAAFWCPDLRPMRSRSTAQAALPRAHLQRRPGAVHRHRAAGARRGRRPRPAEPALLFRLGHPHRGRPRRATTRCPTTTARSGRTTTR